ncbi:uncharacterized protein ColSpa_02484 [Colletotrichum spaethianum]|uniref:Uncharacterized protein n=1 Tax=Colletotrichum spaethianum TaxID=700344 RepID=A0AA37L9R0_9PEZI|nr:uncharacterized protein ColSpa_02484 [Colletotrichum spaethianum]GKT42303.1 hypothetical protein ColSpa_02484 [Colletotrichum spaethianum]
MLIKDRLTLLENRAQQLEKEKKKFCVKLKRRKALRPLQPKKQPKKKRCFLLKKRKGPLPLRPLTSPKKTNSLLRWRPRSSRVTAPFVTDIKSMPGYAPSWS